MIRKHTNEDCLVYKALEKLALSRELQQQGLPQAIQGAVWTVVEPLKDQLAKGWRPDNTELSRLVQQCFSGIGENYRRNMGQSDWKETENLVKTELQTVMARFQPKAAPQQQTPAPGQQAPAPAQNLPPGQTIDVSTQL